MTDQQKAAALKNETYQVYRLAKRLAERAARLADKARRWEFIDTAEDVGAFAGDLASARRDCLWHRLPDGVADREND